MKKLIALLMVLTMILSLAACGKKEEAPAEPETPEVETPEAEVPVDPEVEDTVIEMEPADPEADVPAAPTEEPDVPAAMPTVPETPAVTPEVPAEPETPAEPEAPVAPAPEAPAAGSVDLNAFYLSLLDTYGENFPATMNLCESQELLDAFYAGLSAIGTKQLMIYQPMMGAVVCEIALVEVENAADMDAVKAILQGRIDAQVEGGAWYPESIEGWKNNSRIVVKGNCIMMIAYSECDAVVSAFEGLF
jgi:predicted small lipoprotein YifL